MIISAEEFVKLRESENPDEYQRAACEEASDDVWMKVIYNYPDMKKWVVYNKTVPLSVLYFLSDDSDSSVRSAIADKRKLDRALFEKLSKDKVDTIRHRIAVNKKTPKDILKVLSCDEEEFVRNAALKRLAR